MSTPQAQDVGENSADPSEDQTIENGNAETTNRSTSKNEGNAIGIIAKPATPSKEHVHDPNKITLKFIFANRDGVNVILDCKPSSTVAEVKGALLSMWPKGEIKILSHCPSSTFSPFVLTTK